MTKSQAQLSLLETKNGADPKSPERVRTMFRNRRDGKSFSGAMQIVDSQYFAWLLRDRVETEDYFNAYIHAVERGLSSAAGCHFEELLHRQFCSKLPPPIEDYYKSKGTGKEGVSQFKKYKCYWIPSIPNFANIIDAALILSGNDGGTTLWCFQYTISKRHDFNERTFSLKFLHPVLKTFGLKIEEVVAKIVFVVPHDVNTQFKAPGSIVEEGYETHCEFVDCCSSEAVGSLFERLSFIEEPDPTDAKRKRFI